MTEHGWNRRQAVAAIGAGSLAAALPGEAIAENASGNQVFRHGIASGDPDQTSVILWTRVEPAGDAEVPVEWQVARDQNFSDIVKAGRISASSATDFTVKVLVEQLQPSEYYHYRFRARGTTSMTGRTRTLPDGVLDRLGVALVSCSNFPFGFFNAYDAIARDPMVDIVLHTGDYLYEYGAEHWGAEMGRKLGRMHQPEYEIVSLSDYRTRHAQYRSDPSLQLMTATHPFIACWDDHESANNPWLLGAQNHQPETEGSWFARRAASIRAYYEWMPIREPGVGRTRAQFWRSYRFGDLATLVTLETRHTGRAEQIDYMQYADKLKSQADADHLKNDVIGAPDRPMLSVEMEDFLSGELTRSVKAGEPWRVIGNATLLARLNVPDLIGAGLLPEPDTDGISFNTKELAWKAKWNLPIYTDSWDGYGWARERFYALCRDAGADDLIVLTGDSHSFWANQLADAQKKPVGIELGTAGVTSPGDFLDSGFGPPLSKKLDQAFVDMVEEVVWTDNFHQGYVRLDLRRDAAQANFIGMSTITSTRYRPKVLRTFAVSRSKAGLKLIG